MRSVLPATEADFLRVQQMIIGLGENVFRHAQSSTGAMLCGQAFPKAGVVEFAVADSGQGIWSSLKRFPAFVEGVKGDAHAILTALTLKMSLAGGETRPGFLNTLVATARKTGGELVAVSEEAAVSLRGGELRTSPVAPFPGTVIGMRLRLFAK
jgi:hypothetical protein